MAQVDFVNYFSILFWFFILFIIYYYINFSWVIPSIFSALKTRNFIYREKFKSIKLRFYLIFILFNNFNITFNAFFYNIFIILKTKIYVS